MGSGKNGSFDAVPDLQQWAIFYVHDTDHHPAGMEHTIKIVLGNFIAGYLKLFKCEKYLLELNATTVHGKWDGKTPLARNEVTEPVPTCVAVLTRATIRLGKAKYFWKNVAPATASMLQAEGFIFSLGVGEVPWLKQATLSVWESQELMKKFAYGTKTHAEIIKKTRKEQWYSEEMFARFIIKRSLGTIRGKNPLEGIM